MHIFYFYKKYFIHFFFTMLVLYKIYIRLNLIKYFTFTFLIFYLKICIIFLFFIFYKNNRRKNKRLYFWHDIVTSFNQVCDRSSLWIYGWRSTMSFRESVKTFKFVVLLYCIIVFKKWYITVHFKRRCQIFRRR